MRARRIWSESTLFVVVGVTLAGLAWADAAQTPGASYDAVAGGGPGAPPASRTPVPVATHVSVSSVAGRLDATKRARVKAVVTRVVDGYLDGAFVGGAYPRDDFTAAFAGFREGAAASAAGDLDLLTNHDVGDRVAAVSVTHRRLRIDVLSPDGQPSAATARFVLGFAAESTEAGAPSVAHTVRGSLFLTNQQGAWRVFGYDVRKDARGADEGTPS